jgi:hypothetical protein
MGDLSKTAARMRSYRKRKKRGMRGFLIRVTEGEIDRLLKTGHLEPDDRQSRQAIGEALEAFVSDAFEGVDAL